MRVLGSVGSTCRAALPRESFTGCMTRTRCDFPSPVVLVTVNKPLILGLSVGCLFDENTGASDRKEALTLVRLERHAWAPVMGATVPYNLSLSCTRALYWRACRQSRSLARTLFLSDVPMSVFVELLCTVVRTRGPQNWSVVRTRGPQNFSVVCMRVRPRGYRRIQGLRSVKVFEWRWSHSSWGAIARAREISCFAFAWS